MKQYIHAAAVFVAKFGAKFLPDRIPVTFVGPGSVRELCESVGHQGLTRVLIVTDETLVQLGIVDRVTKALDDVGVASSVYAGVKPDPTDEQVEAGYAQYGFSRCDGVVAVGGGSPIDAAKMIAAMATNGGKLHKLEGKLRVRQPPAPLFAIPTTAGTGSEVTIAAVVSDTESHTKKFFLDPKLLPQMTALDPSLMTGLPGPITAATGMDALTHAIESYVSKTATPQTKAWATTAVRLVFAHLPSAFSRGDDLEARKGMALASYYAGLAFTRTSVGYVHAIAHNVGAFYGTPHGLANAIALPHVLDYSLEAATPQLAELAKVIGLSAAGEAQRAQRFVDAVRELMVTVEIPATLDALQSSDIPAIAKRACAEAFLDYPVPRYMDQAQCEGVVAKMLPA